MKLPSAWRVQAAPSLQNVSGSGADFNGTFKTDGGLDIQARLDLEKEDLPARGLGECTPWRTGIQEDHGNDTHPFPWR